MRLQLNRVRIIGQGLTLLEGLSWLLQDKDVLSRLQYNELHCYLTTVERYATIMIPDEPNSWETYVTLIQTQSGPKVISDPNSYMNSCYAKYHWWVTKPLWPAHAAAA